MHTATKLSPALAFLTAATAAFPRTLGDRDRSSALHALMDVAIDTRMGFDIADGALLSDGALHLRTCVGVFDPMRSNWYHRACAAGGTFARMWERHNTFAPYMAREVFTGKSGEPALKNNRVAPGMAIVISAWTVDDGMLQSTRDGEVWWCTSMDAEKITFCRYASGYCHAPVRPEGRPAKRRTITRAEWDECFAPKRAQMAEAA